MPLGRWAACCVGLCLLLMAADVRAQGNPDGKPITAADDKEARDLFRLGKQAFDEGRYERALKYFKDAYELSGRAALQYNIGSVLDRLRRDREAVEAYKSYLAQTPDATNRAVVEERIQIIEGALARAEPPPAAPPEPVPPAAATATPPEIAAPELAPIAAPTPQQTARAALETQPSSESGKGVAPETEPSKPITSRWWFWTGIGAVAVGAVVVGVAAAASSGSSTVEEPAVLGTATRVRPL